mmetsp:Transcript_21485/g.41705  ORF Transcript_21485/g.41705 Transcript_21485/m.41705 type:complete len:140 (-) Transcript_21485:336-755(-)
MHSNNSCSSKSSRSISFKSNHILSRRPTKLNKFKKSQARKTKKNKAFAHPTNLTNQMTRKLDSSDSKNGEQKLPQTSGKDTSQKSGTDGSQAKSPTLMMKADSNSSLPRNGSSTGLFMLTGGAFGRVPSYPMLSGLADI